MEFDPFWKVNRGRSVILEDYKDEISNSKHKPAVTKVHKGMWLPYGERPVREALSQADYGRQLLQLVKGSTAAAKSGELLKVRLHPCLHMCLARVAYLCCMDHMPFWSS